MVRLILVLAPVACILGGIGMSGLLSTYIPNLDAGAALLAIACRYEPWFSTDCCAVGQGRQEGGQGQGQDVPIQA